LIPILATKFINPNKIMSGLEKNHNSAHDPIIFSH
jgi:hypothetical protein